jgi:hypothetical protein
MSTALRVEAAARATTGEVLLSGKVNQWSGNSPDQTQPARARAAGISVRTQRLLDRLAKVRPDLLDEVRAGRLSAYRAAVEAGIVKEAAEAEHAAVVADGSDRGHWHAIRAALDGLAGCPIPVERLVELTPTHRLARMASTARAASRIAADLADRLEARLGGCIGRGIVKLTNLTLNSPPEEACQRRRSSGKFFTIGCIM